MSEKITVTVNDIIKKRRGGGKRSMTRNDRRFTEKAQRYTIRQQPPSEIKQSLIFY